MRLTYANVMATIAVFIALGGGAWAISIGRNDVGAREIAKNAVGSSELRNDKAKGKDILESSLGTVPNADRANRATTANQADSATTADNAAAVEGNIVRRVAHASGNVTDQPVLDLAGLQLDVTCTGGSEDLEATSTVPGGEISGFYEDAGANDASFAEDDFGPGSTVDVNNGTNSSDNVIEIRYTGGDGRVVVANLVTEDVIGGNDCLVSGFAIGG